MRASGLPLLLLCLSACSKPAEPDAVLDGDAWFLEEADLREERDLLAPADLSSDLAPASCVFARDCGDAEKWQCCVGKCYAKNDRNNCGACGRACGADPAIDCCGSAPGQFSCFDLRKGMPWCGSCRGVLPGADEWCPISDARQCCDGICTLRKEDRNNCGGCGIKCAPLQVCINSVCQLS